jgi:parvulin-like peptidyl-prolyl isomerase
LPYRVAAEQILIRHAGAFDAGKTTRSPEDCLELAQRTVAELRQGKRAFEDACRDLSEDPISRGNGGLIGIFHRGQLADDFRGVEKALFSLEMGAISDPVESPFGLHIFRRVPIEEWSGSHILIQWKGCRNAPSALERTRDEALTLAQRLLERAQSPGADFADLARRQSEAPDRAQGGSLGIFTKGEILGPLEKAIKSSQPGQVTGPIETELGWHIARREPIRRARAAEILISFQGKEGKGPVKRTKVEAMKLAEEVLARARSEGSNFTALAETYSEAKTAKEGGDTGLLTPGKWSPEVEKAVLLLEVGQVSPVIETPEGFCILKRLPEE